MPRIALATCAGFPELAPDDQHLRETLAGIAGVQVQAEVWTDTTVDWKSYHHVVLRSTWDYPSDVPGFSAWLKQLASEGIRVHNSPDRVLWNIDKRYLHDVATVANIVPTHWTGAEGLRDSVERWRERGWTEGVVKPQVSLNAMQTHRVPLDQVAEFVEQVPSPMVQPFLPEVLRDGEWSFLFFGGALSHTVVKRPKDGDYRVQDTYGGTAELVDPPAALRESAERVVDNFASDTTYARVDGINVGGVLHIMEVELIEPSLFLLEAKGAAERLAKLVLGEG